MLPAEQHYHITEQELLAVVDTLGVFRHYLEGISFTVVTDNKLNTFFESQPTLSRRQARWRLLLRRFLFTWAYKPGGTKIADPGTCVLNKALVEVVGVKPVRYPTVIGL